MDFSHIATAASAWILAHLSAPTVQLEIDKVLGRTNGSRKVGKLSLAELKDTLGNSLSQALAPQNKSLEAIAATNQEISTGIKILVDRSR